MKVTLYVDVCYDKKEYKIRKKQEKADSILQFINNNRKKTILKQKNKEDDLERKEYNKLKKNINKLNKKIERRIRKIKKVEHRVDIKIVPSNEVIKIVKKLDETNKKNSYLEDCISVTEQSKNMYYENLTEILNNIIKAVKKEPKEQSIYLLLKQSSNLDNKKIGKLLSQYKIIYIITENVKQYRKIEQFAEEEAEMIIILNNRKKSLSKAKYIINYDFTQEDIEKFNVNRTAIILNTSQNKIKIHQGFQGIVINNIKLKNREDEKYPIEYDVEKNREKIMEKIKNEEYYLIGENGRINKGELLKLQ